MTVKAAIGAAMVKAREGIEYSPKNGATCPMCGKRCPVVSSPKWSGNLKVRYHRCTNRACVLCQVEASVKSVQVDAST
tara:strand:- start:6157 stop:6390 length:234 start_codon:yes stop_codon:yes gene_type:complete